MCNLDILGVFSVVKFNSEPLFFLDYGQKMLPLRVRAHIMDENMAQICPLQELASGVLEARDVKRHNFFDYFPHVYTH